MFTTLPMGPLKGEVTALYKGNCMHLYPGISPRDKPLSCQQEPEKGMLLR